MRDGGTMGANSRRPVLLYACEGVETEAWLAALRRELSEFEVRVWPDAGELADITLAFVWKHPAGMLGQLPNLRGIFSLGAGVESILADPELPADVPLIRMVDPSLAAGMNEFVLMRVLHYHRDMDRYAVEQRRHAWAPAVPPLPQDRRVGLLGLGALGGLCARSLAALNFDVAAWSRSEHAIEGVRCYFGLRQLTEFLRRTEILVCLLPLTADTDSLLDRRRLAELPRGAFLINVARGPHVIDADLIDALDSGQLAGATLDVFRHEPLPPQHPFWSHPKITVVPHIAAVTQVRTAAVTLAANVRLLLSGRPVPDVVDRTKGY
jgi:glyoxylate/hydroxypyruvate reductase A